MADPARKVAENRPASTREFLIKAEVLELRNFVDPYFVVRTHRRQSFL